MPHRRALTALSPLLRARGDLLDAGWRERDLGVRPHPSLHRVRRGWYVDRAAWDDLFPEDRHALHVLAVARDLRGDAIVSHTSAAVLHGLDLFRLHPARVHLTTAPDARISSGDDVTRHCAEGDAADVTQVHGIRCTLLARTVLDVARSLPVEPALVIADGAERAAAEVAGAWDADAAAVWRDGLALRLDAATGLRGVRRARRVVPFADGRAETTLESISRLQLHRLGFRDVRLQVAVAGPHGRDYRVDFGLDEADAWGECDGESKYRDDAQRSGRSAEQVVIDEKRREDWIRGVTHRRVVRWGARDAGSPAALAARLTAFGIRCPR